jgi:hypothetical protein
MNMSKYKCDVGDFVEFPVQLEINSNGKAVKFSFHFTGKRLSVQQWADYFGDDGAQSGMQVTEFLKTNLTGWRDQKLVVDKETNQPAPFDGDALEAMLGLMGVSQVVLTGYLEAVSRANTAQGRAKN